MIIEETQFEAAQVLWARQFHLNFVETLWYDGSFSWPYFMSSLSSGDPQIDLEIGVIMKDVWICLFVFGGERRLPEGGSKQYTRSSFIFYQTNTTLYWKSVVIRRSSWSDWSDITSLTSQFDIETNNRTNSGVISLPSLDFICFLILSLFKSFTVGLINKGSIKQLSSFTRKSIIFIFLLLIDPVSWMI